MKNINLKISIIIPVYNRQDLLERAIISVLNQTYKNFELIIVNDASTENIKEFVKKFDDKRIKYIEHTINSGGPAKPKNTGIKIAKGDYIAFLDSDDKWLENKLKKQLKLYEKNINNNIGLVGCEEINFNELTQEKRHTKLPALIEKMSPEILKKCLPHSSSSVMIKKSVFKTVGLFSEDFKISDDYDLYIRISRKYKLLFVQEPLFYYYIHNNNASTIKNKQK
ncbi:MAG TPA: glycosyltransferase [Patescibacteria group bacterium]|nr:glycosyltransferase [Patescibacteria group bacterium]